MTIGECYALMGADYNDVLLRLGNEERVRRFLSKLPQDPSFSQLCRSYEQGDAAEAFRAVHSLKGICINLGLAELYHSSFALTEALRGGQITPQSARLMEQVRLDYEKTIACIRQLES